MQKSLLKNWKGKAMKEVCANCRWLESLPFSDECICGCDESEYADCPCDYPENDTCAEWQGKEDED